MRTTTQEIWGWLGEPPFPPPALKRGQSAPVSPRCWLCGGESGANPWLMSVWLTPTFTNHTRAACPASDAICQACAYLGSGDSWRDYCAARPEMNLKSVPPLSWRTYSHVFRPGYHVCPGRMDWRGWLTAPPEPPFVYLMAESGQKHLLYRARVSHGRERYWLQVEEDAVLVDRGELVRVLFAFERLLGLGFTRDEVRSGNYSAGRTLKAGLENWRTAEAAIAGDRARTPDYLRICATAAHGPRQQEGGA